MSPLYRLYASNRRHESLLPNAEQSAVIDSAADPNKIGQRRPPAGGQSPRWLHFGGDPRPLASDLKPRARSGIIATGVPKGARGDMDGASSAQFDKALDRPPGLPMRSLHGAGSGRARAYVRPRRGEYEAARQLWSVNGRQARRQALPFSAARPFRPFESRPMSSSAPTSGTNPGRGNAVPTGNGARGRHWLCACGRSAEAVWLDVTFTNAPLRIMPNLPSFWP